VDRSERIRLIAGLRDGICELSYEDAELVMEKLDLGFMTRDDWEFDRACELGRLLRVATDDDLVSLGSHLVRGRGRRGARRHVRHQRLSPPPDAVRIAPVLPKALVASVAARSPGRTRRLRRGAERVLGRTCSPNGR